MSNPHYQNYTAIVLHGVEDPVISDSNAIDIARAPELFRTPRMRILAKGSNASVHSAKHMARKGGKVSFRRRFQSDPIDFPQRPSLNESRTPPALQT